MWQPVALKLVKPKRLTAKIFGHFHCLLFGSTAAVGDGCAPKSTWLGRPEIRNSNSHFICCYSFLMVLQSNTTSIALSLAIAGALVMAGSVLRSWNAVQRCDPVVESCQKFLSVPWGAVEGKGAVEVAKGCKWISSHTDVHTSFSALGSRMECPHLPFSCLFQLHRSRRAFPLFFPPFLFLCSCLWSQWIAA